jgi:hypothetical protein
MRERQSVKVLVGCERSRAVASAFEARGHKVLSCDLEPARRGGAHYMGDVFDVIDYPWDLAIFHPPCTHTAVSGAKHFAEKWQDGRQAFGLSFILALVRRSEHIPRVVIEQPVSILSSHWRKPDQVIHPHMFGHPEYKATCLWLKGLPLLQPTHDMREQMRDMPKSLTDRIHRMPPGPDRAEKRSETYQGIADAFADQYGGLAAEDRAA